MITLYACLRAFAPSGRMTIPSTFTWIHGAHKHESAGICNTCCGSGNSHASVLKRLAQSFQRVCTELGQLVQKQHTPRTGSSSLCQTVGQLHIVPLWGKYPGVNYPTPGVAVRGYNHPIKKELQKTIQFWGPIFTFSIIAISYRVFNYWSHSEKNILH